MNASPHTVSGRIFDETTQDFVDYDLTFTDIGGDSVAISGSMRDVNGERWQIDFPPLAGIGSIDDAARYERDVAQMALDKHRPGYAQI